MNEKDEDVLEQEQHVLRKSVIDKMLDESGDVIDAVEDVFKKVKAEFSMKKEVIDYLDFVDKPVGLEVVRDGSDSDSKKSKISQSCSVGGGPDQAKRNIPKLRSSLEKDFNRIKDKFEGGKALVPAHSGTPHRWLAALAATGLAVPAAGRDPARGQHQLRGGVDAGGGRRRGGGPDRGRGGGGRASLSDPHDKPPAHPNSPGRGTGSLSSSSSSRSGQCRRSNAVSPETSSQAEGQFVGELMRMIQQVCSPPQPAHVCSDEADATAWAREQCGEACDAFFGVDS